MDDFLQLITKNIDHNDANDLLAKKQYFIMMHNGVIEKTNISSLHRSSIVINESIDVLLVHEIDQDCTMELIIKDNLNIKMTEIMNINRNAKVLKNVFVGTDSHFDIAGFECYNSRVVINTNTQLEDKAYINCIRLSLFLGQATVSEQWQLNGVKAQIDQYNVFINNSSSAQNISAKVFHNIKETTSKMTNYAICKGSSALNINTDGIIKNGAKGSHITQKSKGILLDTQAVISANPLLHIDEFDCLASHGAGIGSIDEEEIYYLMSRGLNRVDSEKLIINGFIYPVYEAISDGNTKKVISEMINKYL